MKAIKAATVIKFNKHNSILTNNKEKMIEISYWIIKIWNWMKRC